MMAETFLENCINVVEWPTSLAFLRTHSPLLAKNNCIFMVCSVVGSWMVSRRMRDKCNAKHITWQCGANFNLCKLKNPFHAQIYWRGAAIIIIGYVLLVSLFCIWPSDESYASERKCHSGLFGSWPQLLQRIMHKLYAFAHGILIFQFCMSNFTRDWNSLFWSTLGHHLNYCIFNWILELFANFRRIIQFVTMIVIIHFVGETQNVFYAIEINMNTHITQFMHI